MSSRPQLPRTARALKSGMTTPHSIVWLDHEEAKIIHFNAEAIRQDEVVPPPSETRFHAKAATSGRRDEHTLQHYFSQVAKALDDSQQVLVVGPSTAKLELLRALHRNHPQLEKRVIGVETVDHPTDRQLAAYAKKYFLAAAHGA